VPGILPTPRECEKRHEHDRKSAQACAMRSLYNRNMRLPLEAIVIEHIVLGVFLVVPLLIVAFLFSDELWQEHRDLHDMRAAPVKPRRIDWRHPLRRDRHHPR
jgi:hypothetical protein